MSNTGINLRQTSPNLIIKTLLTTYQLILDRIHSGKKVTDWLRSLASLGAEVEELLGSEEDGELARLVEC